MHIKQVIISGFRSFRNQNEIEPFSSKHNVIVGRNGSGKSNFFDAIQFVLLAPKFANLRQEDRQLLLHEGAGSSVMAAYVEIVFDNSDGRFPVESDEVVLRRTVGHKKDEFFLNRKRVQKSEVISLLESAGFSKSNPFYIVQQGKVSNLCVMKDKDRLELLKEVAGTTVYEDRRNESIKITQETTSKQEQIDEVLKFIEDRLSELEEEKEELTDYEQLDKSRRALEYILYDKELVKATQSLQEVEATRSEEREKQQDLYTLIREIQDELQVTEDNLNSTKSSFDKLLVRKSNKDEELSRLLNSKSNVEVNISELENKTRAQMEESKQLELSLQDVNQAIEIAKRELDQVNPVYDELQSQHNEMNDELEILQHRIEMLYGKQGRNNQFRTKKERDNFLQDQISKLEAQHTSISKILDKLRKDIALDEKKLLEEKRILTLSENENKERTKTYKTLGSQIQELTSNRNNFQEKRKAIWQNLENIQEKIQDSRNEMEKGKQVLSSTLPRHISQGLAMVEHIANEKNLNGYYGPLIDNFELRNNAFQTAVEVAAGNALFHVIVDTDSTASILMKELDRRKAGRLTFLPLNRLVNNVKKYPESNDVRSLMEVALEYEDDFEIAIRHVFGNKLLARDLDVAANFAKDGEFDAITRDGDVVNRKGGFEGGYRDERASKIGAVYRIRSATQTLLDLQATELSLKKELEDIENSINNAIRNLSKLEAERDHIQQANEQLVKELSSRSEQLVISQTKLQKLKDQDIKSLEKDLASIQSQIDDYREEQQSPLHGKLSDLEREELIQSHDRKQNLQSSLETLQRKIMSTTTKRENLSADLNNNLLKRQGEIKKRLDEIGSSSSASTSSSSSQSSSSSATGGMGDLKDFEGQMILLDDEKAHILQQIKDIEKDIVSIEKEIDVKKIQVASIEQTFDKLTKDEAARQEQLVEVTKLQDKLLNKVAMFSETIVTKQKLLRDIGTLPRIGKNGDKDIVDEFKAMNEKELLKQLKVVNDKLKKYSGVNRKALDQYISFMEQRDTLVQRKEELDRDFEAIEQLIQSLDTQKEEAILRTFRGVSFHFSQVFSEIVSGGSGQLVMKTTDDENEDEMESSIPSSKSNTNGNNLSLNTQSQAISRFRGVQVRVSFGASSQQFEMQQLSGGQKAIVALSLIFAIQRCDPAPFYLFDEIDQALDANYRAGVARLIQKQCNSVDAPAQFITTTFRPEMVQVADKCYGIALHNKVSNIYPLEKVDAQNFVESILNEVEIIGKVSNVPKSSPASSTFGLNQQVTSDNERDDNEEEEEEEPENDEAEDFEGFEEAAEKLKPLTISETVPEEEEAFDDEEEEESIGKRKSKKRGSKRK